MTELLFPAPSQPTLPIANDQRRFPVHRIYCVGRNYAEHVREMGGTPEKQRPVFFAKPADAVVESGASLDYPLATADLHHEVELVVALASGGSQLDLAQAQACIAGYAVGVDLTRRDLQHQAKNAGQPWDTAKGFDQSAPIGALSLAGRWTPAGQRICLTVGAELRQDGRLDQMILAVPQIIVELSQLFTLAPGDLIFTGTPHGVAALQRGDQVQAEIEGLPPLHFSLRP